MSNNRLTVALPIPPAPPVTIAVPASTMRSAIPSSYID
jgi:hypothetical protein